MHTLPRPSPTGSGLVIDWTGLQLGSSTDSPAAVLSLIQWVESFPRQQAIHVYLPSVADRVSARRLQSALQTLGCTVTRKVQLCIR